MQEVMKAGHIVGEDLSMLTIQDSSAKMSDLRNLDSFFYHRDQKYRGF